MAVKNRIKLVQEAISSLDDQQLEKVLSYVENLRQEDLLNQRAQASEEAVAYGKVVSLDQFNKDFEQWKRKKDLMK